MNVTTSVPLRTTTKLQFGIYRDGDNKRSRLAAFVAHTLDEAERNGAKQTWLDLVDHGGADAPVSRIIAAV